MCLLKSFLYGLEQCPYFIEKYILFKDEGKYFWLNEIEFLNLIHCLEFPEFDQISSIWETLVNFNIFKI